MATTTPNFGWSVPTSSDLVKNGATAIETLGDAIDASLLDLKGGTTGQVLAKASGTDMDFSWTTPASGATFVGASAYRTSSQTISNATETALTFNDENYDTNSFHDNVTNNTRMTVPAGKAGKYLITAQTVFTNNDTGQRIVYVYVNSTLTSFTGPAIGGSASIDLGLTTSYVANLAVNDIVEVRAYQNSGGSLAILGNSNRASFQVSYLGA